jgi:hypothetical protein
MFASLFRFPLDTRNNGGLLSFGFITALDEHVKWKLHFETSLRSGANRYSELQVARGDNTKLALWLAEISGSPQADETVVHDLREAFFRFYAAAAHAVSLAERGETSAAQQFIAHGDYQEGSRRMKRLLVEMEQRRVRETAGAGGGLRSAAA